MQSAQTPLSTIQARARTSVTAGFEELQALDRELARQARSAGALRFAIAIGLQLLAKGGYRELGFRSMTAYALDRCERRSRWTEQSLALARRSAGLPLLRAALLSGRLSWTKAVIIAGVASPDNEAEWLAAASELTAKTLRERARGKADVASETDDEGDAAAEVDEDAHCTLTVTVNAEDGWLFECASLMVRHLEGQGAPVASVVEAAMAEGMTSLLPRVPRGAIELPEGDAAGAAQRAYNVQREKWRAEAEEQCEARILQAPEVSDCGVESTVPMDGSPEDLDAEVRRRAADLAELSVRIGALAEVFLRADGWRRLGYATDRQYARERLGTSVSSLKEKRALARRGIRRLPRAAESMRDGKIGFEAARLVTEVATPATEEVWVTRAEDRTVVHLREEVKAAGLLSRIGLNGDAKPPSVEMMTALRELEARVVTGADLPVKLRAKLGQCQKAGPEPELASQKSAGAGVLCDARVVEASSSLAGIEVPGASQRSAVSPCSSAVNLDQSVYAEPALRDLERALAREDSPPRLLRSKGRTTLRLRVTEGTRRTYRWLERLYVRYRPSNRSFLAYCSSELLGVWAHARPPVAYASVYARDGFRCANPVCGARHVTPHHVVFRSRGGSDADTNVTSLCLECHLEGVHEGCITVTGSAPDLLWVLGRNAHTVVQGRRRVRYRSAQAAAGAVAPEG